jgi:polysaccharide deacetylase family sporulation protein PdaB
MKQKGIKAVLLLALVMVTGLSILYWKSVGDEIVTVTSSVDGRELPIYSVETDKPQISISFDAAWGNEDTQQILDILNENQVKATFFMTGGWVEAYPDDVKHILEAGHDLGNHSENHKQMSELSAAECQEEIMKVHKKVKDLTGYEMTLFRPPFGDYNNTLINTVYACGYYPIQWNVDSLDWKNYGVDSIIKTVCEHKNLKNGAIILCHNGAKYTAQALDTVIKNLKEKGYEFVPLSQLIYREKYHMQPDGTQTADQN